MPTAKRRELDKKKAAALAHLKANPKASITDIENLFGLSKGTAQRLRAKFTQNTLNGTPNQPKPETTQSIPEAPKVEKSTPALDFEPSPAPPDKKGGVEGAWQSLKGMLGLSDEKKPATTLSAKLNEKQQLFVDSATPTLSLAFIALATYLWNQASGNPDIGTLLAPDEKTAQRIVEPLLRIYARHASFLTDINPDVADAGAAMFALFGYVNASMKLYQHIKEQENEQAQNGNGNGVGRGGNWRDYRPATAENGASHAGSGLADVHGASGANGSGNGANGGHPGSIPVPHLSDEEARQYAALSRLSAMDYQYRARRSGRA